MDVTKLREQIPTCQRMAYMNTGWSGPSPASVLEAIKNRLDYEVQEGPANQHVYESGKVIDGQVCEAVAGLLGVSPEEIATTESTTEGLNMVINGLPWHEGDEVITCDLEHPSVLMPCYYLQRRHGVVARVLSMAPNEAQEAIVAKVEEAITPRTRMVFFSHIQFSTGLRMPVKQIRELTRRQGILMLLDGAQTAGHIPLNLRELDCDFYSIPGQKWLLGPDGVGTLYIRRDRIPEVEPAKVSGRAATSFDRQGNLEPNTSDMEKFHITTTSIALRAGLMEGIRFITGVGVSEIEARNLTLAGRLKNGLVEVPGVKVLSPLEGPGACGLVSFVVEGVEPEQAVSRLWDRRRVVIRPVAFPSCIRASLDFFNTEEEVDLLLEGVRELATK